MIDFLKYKLYQIAKPDAVMQKLQFRVSPDSKVKVLSDNFRKICSLCFSFKSFAGNDDTVFTILVKTNNFDVLTIKVSFGTKRNLVEEIDNVTKIIQDTVEIIEH